MASIARGLVARGFAVLRFNFAYRERALALGAQAFPDEHGVLEAALRRAHAELEQRAGSRRILLGGKSLGARIASHVAAQGERCHGLVSFGFPLHPQGKASLARSEHFAALAQPALFLQGTRDGFCDLGLLRQALERYGGKATLEVIEGADHGFAVPHASGVRSEEVMERVLDRVADWEDQTFPA